MRLSPLLLLSFQAALLSVTEGHEHRHEHAHRHHQFVGRQQHAHQHNRKRLLDFSIGPDGISLGSNLNLDPFATPTTKATTSTKSSSTTAKVSTTSTARSSSKTPTTISSKTTSKTTSSPTTTSKTTTVSTTSSKSSSAPTSTTKAAQTSSKATGTTTKTSSVATSVSSSIRAVVSNTNSTSNSTISGTPTTVGSTILVLARNQDGIDQAISGLNGYGIPYKTLIVPSSGAQLPTLNTSAGGNFGGIIVSQGLVYQYGDSWHSALTDDQWNQLYTYQTKYSVRMVQWDVYPSGDFGVSAIGGCCDDGVEQTLTLTNTTAFKQAGLRQGAGMSTDGLYHYIAQISDASTTTEIAQFAANSQAKSGTAAVINNFNGREQMVFFISWATSWSPTSTALQHAYITWMTRGLYAGYRRVNLATQIDDVMLRTEIYYPKPNGTTNYYRLTVDDMNNIMAWTQTINAKMNKDSYYRVELGHNGNGNIIYADAIDTQNLCDSPIYTQYTSTALEFQKPLGSGTDGWPTTPKNYSFTKDCLSQDPMWKWMSTPSNRDSFYHISHTFTHEGQNNATYNDIFKEINWNQQWFAQSGIGAVNFSADGLIPPQITGLHNGDALRAWSDNGLTNCVGDNSRSVLRNQQNDMYAYTTTVADNGFAGITVVPRWAGRIFFNCDTPECTTQEWKDATGSTGDFSTLMSDEIHDATRYLLGLYHDGFMFHQLNMRNQGVSPITTPDGTRVNSLLQNWVENVVQEFVRLVDWPIRSLKQTDLAQSFRDRQTRDACNYQLSWNLVGGSIVGVTVSSSSNSCSAAIPVTVPADVIDSQGFTREQIGNDPLTVWVKLSGQPVTLTLSSPITL